MAAHASGTAPTQIPARPPQPDEVDEVLARSLDAYARSLPTTMPFLEAEPVPVLLPHDEVDEANGGGGGGGGSSSSSSSSSSSTITTTTPEEDRDGGRHKRSSNGNHVKNDDETTPLLRDRDASGCFDDPSAASSPRPSPLFLNGVSPARFWCIFAQILASLFVGCFDSTVMASSHPAVTAHFRAAHAAAWLSTTFLLASTACQPLLGRLSDGLGRRPLFLAGVALLAVGTAWCAAAPTLASFVAARALCGVGAGGAIALGSIMTSDLVPIERRGSYQSLVNATWGTGSALGAAAGGWLVETVGWRWEFGIQVPLLVLIFAASFVAIPHDIGLRGKPRKTVRQVLREFDLRGSGLLTVATAAFILGVNLGGAILPWSHPIVIASLATFAVAFPTFLWVESRAPRPIMPLHLITKTPHANLIFGNFIASMLANAILFNMPLYFQAVLLTSATTSGLRLVVPSIASSVAGVSTGFLITYTRRLKWPLLLGASLAVLGNLVLLLLLRRDLRPAALYVLALVPSSLGTGFQFPGTFMAVLAASPQAEQAVVTSTLLLWRSLGGVLGIAASSLVVQAALLHHLRRLVRGPRRDEVIEAVKRSVEVVAGLEEPYREQVVRSYEATLRLTFLFTTVMAVVGFLLLAPIKLKRLPARK